MIERTNTVLLALVLTAVVWLAVRTETRQSHGGRYVPYGDETKTLTVLDTTTGEIHVLFTSDGQFASMHTNRVTGQNLRRDPTLIDGETVVDLQKLRGR